VKEEDYILTIHIIQGVFVSELFAVEWKTFLNSNR